MKILIIDDALDRHEWLTKDYLKQYPDAKLFHAHNFDEAVILLNTYSFGLISFDHELLDFKKVDGKFIEFTGADIAQYMVDHSMKATEIRVHSWNLNAATNIISILQEANVSPNIYYDAFCLGKLS